MALSGWTGNANYVGHGGAGLDDVQLSYSYAMWVYNETSAAHNVLWNKGANDAGRFRHDLSPARWSNSVDRATTDLILTADFVNFAAWGQNKWVFIGAAFDGATSANCKLYMGDLATPCAEPSAYRLQQAGSGAITSNAANDLLIGVTNPPNLEAFVGRIATHWAFSRVLSQAEFRQLQFRGAVSNGANRLLHVHYGYNGTGTQTDYSGNGNHGTITGTLSVASHVPIPFRRSGPLWVPYSAAAPGGFVPFPRPRGMTGGMHILGGGMAA